MVQKDKGGGEGQRKLVPWASRLNCCLMVLCGRAILVKEDQRNKILRSLLLYQLQAAALALSKDFCFQGHLGNSAVFFSHPSGGRGSGYWWWLK